MWQIFESAIPPIFIITIFIRFMIFLTFPAVICFKNCTYLSLFKLLAQNLPWTTENPWFFTGLADEEKNDDYDQFHLIMEMGTNKQFEREYLIYDSWNMVGTIGGALGLFVGFSFYDFIVMFINFISKKCEKVNPEPDDSSSDLKTMKENLDILRAGTSN